MKYLTELSKEFRFEAAHRLPFVSPGHKCGRLHGHSFRVKITVRGSVDPLKGWIVDYDNISNAFEPLFQSLDHNYLNDVEGLENPTAENLASWIFQRLKINGAHIHSVKIKETCTSECTVYATDPE